MGIIRIEKTNNFTVMSNHHLKNKQLSLKAKGLMSLMLSLPDDWDYSIAGLVSIVAEGRTAVSSAMNELMNQGYVVREVVRENGKISDWNYTVYEFPIEVSLSDSDFLPAENLKVENQEVENQAAENSIQLNTKEINTKKNKELNIQKAPAPAPVSVTNTKRNFRKEHEHLTDELSSGEVIDNEKKERKKKSNYEKCLDELSSRNFSDDVKELLQKHLEWSYYSKDPKRIKDRISYKPKLNMLEQLIKKGEDASKVVQQSIDRQWHAFYEYKSVSDNRTKFEVGQDTIKIRDLEEAKEAMRRKDEEGVEIF